MDAGIAWAADELLGAEGRVTARLQITEEWPALDTDLGYAVQDETLHRRLRRGESLAGIKLGLTSAAKQHSIGISVPVTGWLTGSMLLPAGTPVPLNRLIQPRAEPEIVLVLGERLAGPGVTQDDALAAVASVRAGIEIIDSRYLGFRFTLPDVVADNTSSGLFVLGDTEVAVSAIDLAAESCRLSVDGQQVATATGAAVLGHPAAALALAANELARRGKAIEAGSVVFTGSLTEAVRLTPGIEVVAEFGHLGQVRLTAAP
ncbi:4-oxalocrotonate decarboxylase [Kibdelosporangium aridum]|uniref:4-oxalocrotonate decarboxylase n=1 Tax=Kibdelosporangium aridum TaxID=2030 RepID=A0A428Z0G8_KIBAR|nr:fumarylacetoacetate hydrolase family protein [Kibdelosporangium aridum]RSM77788.1 4-oxalocrotonate decarboxylase [Kibdelosporangium aridum]